MRNEEIKQSLFADDVIVCMENKASTKQNKNKENLLELLSSTGSQDIRPTQNIRGHAYSSSKCFLWFPVSLRVSSLISVTFPLSLLTPGTLTSSRFLGWAKFFPISGPLYLLFPLIASFLWALCTAGSSHPSL